MKANRKFVEGEEGVSAVIGVILMVAITVAIAATVYVYVSGMIGTSPESAPDIQFVKDASAGRLTVAKAAPSDLIWSDLEISANGTALDGTSWDTWFVGTIPTTAAVNAGDYIELNTTAAIINIRHVATNTLLGSWTFT